MFLVDLDKFRFVDGEETLKCQFKKLVKDQTKVTKNKYSLIQGRKAMITAMKTVEQSWEQNSGIRQQNGNNVYNAMIDVVLFLCLFHTFEIKF